ncbi:transglutaminase domain-containing protein [Alicyclobacillus sp. SO9]|uniref:transglutaminase domain-containing protein n=1 Tax=Alicyclobacillus sp. SO9 TaxID=2665646 RepID=UPI0018E80D2F|nr:transglutaminase-like domain-containing protein [Alicyclobacillus sp. SO9]QQE79055.1 transglutaminase domain-containing protein [Alicyclobacillus sp. SO9]
MAKKLWGTAIALVAAFDVLLFHHSQNALQTMFHGITEKIENVTSPQPGQQLAAEGRSSASGSLFPSKSHHANTVHDSSVPAKKVPEKPASTVQHPSGKNVSSSSQAATISVPPAGVAPGVVSTGAKREKWYNHEHSTIQLQSLRYGGSNHFPIKGTYGHFNGDLVVLVGVFNSAKTDVTQWWTYSVPVANGTIDSTITLPYHGELEVNVAPEKVNKDDEFTTSSHFTFTNIYNPYPSLSSLQMGELQSWLINYNENPGIHALASKIVGPVQNADAGLSSSQLTLDEIRAVSNWVSEHISYNWPAYNNNQVPWQQATKTFQVRKGVCNDESALSAALLRSIGIPSRVISGTGSTKGVNGPHQWNESWDGTKWILFDPTWDQVYYDSQTHKVGLPAKTNYSYFNLPPKQFNKTHLNGKLASW